MKISERLLKTPGFKTEEYRIYGPPGTGKTTWLAENAVKAGDIYGPDQVSICSLTNSAVSEVFGRELTLSEDNISTLHARCKRALSAPAPAETRVKEFAEAYPQYTGEGCFPPNLLKVKASEDNDNEPLPDRIMSGKSTLYDKCQILRQQLVPKSQWPLDVLEFFNAWDDWCRETENLDFTGWLELALELRPLPTQQVVFVDEAQDHTPLQLAVLRSWNAKKLILIGDDDQNLYEWSGAIPEHLFQPELPQGQEEVLSQSYRVPRQVHNKATGWIKSVSKRRQKSYYPRDYEGGCQEYAFDLKAIETGLVPGPLMDQLYGQEKTIMFLTSCGYMLSDLIDFLKIHRIPFHNPYRKRYAYWNPLKAAGTRIFRFMTPKLKNRVWTGEEAISWAKAVKGDEIFKPGKKQAFLSECDVYFEKVLEKSTINRFLQPKVLDYAFKGDFSIMERNRTKSVPGSWDYAFDILKLPEKKWTPKVIIGTIHSVKGGQADDVFLFPDLSPAAMNDYSLGYGRDRIIRLFYVGMTRARENLLLCQSSQRRSVSW